MRHSQETHFLLFVTQISWLQKWTVIAACHHWCIKLRHIHDMAETSLVMRDGNGNQNSSPTFLCSAWGHLRIPHVSKNMGTSYRRKSNNGKRTRKQTQLIYSSGARGWNVMHSWTLATGNIQGMLLFHKKRRSNWCRGDWPKAEVYATRYGDGNTMHTHFYMLYMSLTKLKSSWERKTLNPKTNSSQKDILWLWNEPGLKNKIQDWRTPEETSKKEIVRLLGWSCISNSTVHVLIDNEVYLVSEWCNT